MLHAGTREADRIALLEYMTDHGSRHLAANDHHRDRIHVGCHDAGHRIGNTGAGGHEADTHFAGGTQIGVSGVNCGLFLAHEDVLEFVLLVFHTKR